MDEGKKEKVIERVEWTFLSGWFEVDCWWFACILWLDEVGERKREKERDLKEWNLNARFLNAGEERGVGISAGA